MAIPYDRIRRFVTRWAARTRGLPNRVRGLPADFQPLAGKQLPLDYGPGFLAINGGKGVKGGLRIPRLNPRVKEMAQAAWKSKALRRWVAPGAVLGGAGVYGAARLDADAKAHAGPLRFRGALRAAEVEVPGMHREGIRASTRVNVGRALHTGALLKLGKRRNGEVVEAGKAGLYLRSRPVGAEVWVRGRRNRNLKHVPKGVNRGLPA